MLNKFLTWMFDKINKTLETFSQENTVCFKVWKYFSGARLGS